MRWLVVDVLVVLLALGALAVTGLALWRRLKRLGTQLGTAAGTLGDLTAQLTLAPPGEGMNGNRTDSDAGARTPRPRHARGVRSVRSS